MKCFPISLKHLLLLNSQRKEDAGTFPNLGQVRGAKSQSPAHTKTVFLLYFSPLILLNMNLNWTRYLLIS